MLFNLNWTKKLKNNPTDDAETCISNLVQALEEAKEKGAKKEEAAEKKHEDGKEKDTTAEDAVESQVDEEAK
jgi:ubiquitin-protein ligase